MILFDEKIVDTLNQYFSDNKECIESIRLSSHGLGIEFIHFRVECSEQVHASINGTEYFWKGAPNTAPWGVLVGQTPQKASLTNPNFLTIECANGDCIKIETIEGQYESVVFTFPQQDDCLVMEVF